MSDVPPTEQEKQSQSKKNGSIGQPCIARAEREKKKKKRTALDTDGLIEEGTRSPEAKYVYNPLSVSRDVIFCR